MSGPDFLRRRDALGEEHPSQLALDRLRLQEPGTETIRTHVEGGAVCQTPLKAGNELLAYMAAPATKTANQRHRKID